MSKMIENAVIENITAFFAMISCKYFGEIKIEVIKNVAIKPMLGI